MAATQLTRTANPNEVGTVAFESWRAGYKAHRDGLRRPCNPYVARGRQLAWNAGWDASAGDVKREESA